MDQQPLTNSTPTLMRFPFILKFLCSRVKELFRVSTGAGKAGKAGKTSFFEIWAGKAEKRYHIQLMRLERLENKIQQLK